MATKSKNTEGLLVRGPFIGVNVTRNSRTLSQREAADALNCDLDGGTIKRRGGFDDGATAPNGQRIEGQHDYRKNDGTRVHLVKAGNQLYKLSGTTFTAIGGAVLTAGNIAQFVTVRDRCYITHGGTPYVTDGDTLHDWQIPQPDYAPTITGVEDGLLVGTYDYKVTFYAAAWGLESPASPPTNETDTAGGTAKTTVVDVAGQWVELSNLPTSADSRVDKLRIYRRKLSNYEKNWFLVEEIPVVADAWTDRTPDGSVSVSVAPLSFDAEYPKARLVAANLDVLFVSGIDGDPSSVWYTRPGTTVLVDRLPLDDDGGEVTSLREFQGQLLVLTSRSHWLISGYDTNSFSRRKVLPDRGCLAPFSVVPADGRVYSLGENGVMAWTGSGVTEVSYPVKDLWLARNFSRDYLIQGVHDFATSAIWWTYSSSAATENDSILVYFYRNSIETQAHSWCPWEIAGATSLVQITDPTTNVRKIHVGFSDGRVAVYRSADDDAGTAIESYWETGDEDIDSPKYKKEFGELVLETQGSGEGFYDIEVSMDSSGVWEMAGDSTPMEKSFRHEPISRTGNQIALRFRSDGDSEIIAWALEVSRSVRS